MTYSLLRKMDSRDGPIMMPADSNQTSDCSVGGYALYDAALHTAAEMGSCSISSGSTADGKDPAATGGMFVATVLQVLGFRSSAWKPRGISMAGLSFPPHTPNLPLISPRKFTRYEISMLWRPI